MNARLRLRCEWVSQRREFEGRTILPTPMPELFLPPKAAPQAPRSNGQGCRVIGTAKAKSDIFEITINQSAMGVVPVDLERGVPAAARHHEPENAWEEYGGR